MIPNNDVDRHQQEINDNFLQWRGEVSATLKGMGEDVRDLRKDHKEDILRLHERIDGVDRKVTNWYIKIIGTSSIVAALVNLLIALLTKNV